MSTYIRKGDYGLVQVMAGTHMGQRGAYLADAQDVHYALVALHAVGAQGPVLIPWHWLQRVDGASGAPGPAPHDANTLVLALALALA